MALDPPTSVDHRLQGDIAGAAPALLRNAPGCERLPSDDLLDVGRAQPNLLQRLRSRTYIHTPNVDTPQLGEQSVSGRVVRRG